MSVEDYEDMIEKAVKAYKDMDPGSAQASKQADVISKLEEAKRKAIQSLREADDKKDKEIMKLNNELAEAKSESKVMKWAKIVVAPTVTLVTFVGGVLFTVWSHNKAYDEHARLNYLDRDQQNELNDLSRPIKRKIV